MKAALLSAAFLAFGLAAAFALMPLIEAGIRGAFALTLAAARWVSANPERFTFCALLAFSALFVYTVNRANARQRKKL